jgi:hypothetical protein
MKVRRKTAPKLSSKAKALQKRLSSAKTTEEIFRLFMSSAPESAEVIARELHFARQNLLVELANLSDAGINRLRNRRKQVWNWLGTVSDDQLMAFRKTLREIWQADHATRIKQLADFMLSTPRGNNRDSAAWLPWFPNARIEPNPLNIYGQIVQGVLDQHERFGICHNPECPAPYFLKRRKDQKHCEMGPCTEYTQRQHANKYWHKAGKRRRQERTKAKKPRKQPTKESETETNQAQTGRKK